MIILATVIIITITNSGIITKSKNAATDYNLTELEQSAQVIYSGYLVNTEVAETQATVGEYIKEELVGNGNILYADKDYIHIDNYGKIEDVKQKVTSADVLIDSIEDLVRFSNNVSAGNTYLGKTIVLTKSLDFTKTISYEDPTSTAFGDINENGTIEPLINELTNKSDSAKGFLPVGGLVGINDPRQPRPFSGTFDALNNEILGIYINRPLDPSGLFGIVDNATIKNLGVNGNISGSYNVAGIVAVANSTTTIINCNNKATLTYKDSATYYAGSIGGIVGGMTAGIIDSCHNIGSIYIYMDGSNCIAGGGIVGRTGGIATICNSYNIGRIYRNASATSSASYVGFGGIIGSVHKVMTKIYNSYNLGYIENNYYPTAGILGVVYLNNSVDIRNVYNGINFNNTLTEQILKNPNNRDYTLSNAYYISTGINSASGAILKTLAEIKSRTFVDLLNANVAAYNSANPTEVKWKNWKTGTDGYPVLAN